jgi:hypothetical protein
MKQLIESGAAPQHIGTPKGISPQVVDEESTIHTNNVLRDERK